LFAKPWLAQKIENSLGSLIPSVRATGGVVKWAS
jgi:hypothetical protein